jgi:hypothetical protein
MKLDPRMNVTVVSRTGTEDVSVYDTLNVTPADGGESVAASHTTNHLAWDGPNAKPDATNWSVPSKSVPDGPVRQAAEALLAATSPQALKAVPSDATYQPIGLGDRQIRIQTGDVTHTWTCQEDLMTPEPIRAALDAATNLFSTIAKNR